MDFYQGENSLISSSRMIFPITPHATNEISPLPKAVRFNAAGDVVLRSVDGTEDVTLTVAAGEILALRVKYIRVAGTTVAAGSIHGLA